MNIVIVVGTRPNFIKITQFERVFKAANASINYTLVHTGQHYDENMSKVFFDQLKLKEPDFYLNIEGLSPAAQIGSIIIQLEKIFNQVKPDLVMVPGDVNSTLAAAIAANKTSCKLAHIESGLRSFDREMPEEVNRILTDDLTDVFLVTEQSGVDHLIKEGKNKDFIWHVGNTMIDTLVAFEGEIEQSTILESLNVKSKSFALMTMHRPRNVDGKQKLLDLIEIIEAITENYQLVLPIHPRTKNSLQKHDLLKRLEDNSGVVFTAALDYLSFQKLIKESAFVITDSGGIQEETTYRQIPCLTLRPNTERPSTIEIGSNELVAFDPKIVIEKILSIKNGYYKKGKVPALWDGKATERIVSKLIAELA